jgi:DNA mismatch repair ATPase MutS
LLDELFRGTNAVERIAAGQAVLLHLLAPDGATNPHIVLAATHDRELVNLISGTFDPFHFGDSVGPDGLIFDHRLRQGPATTRNALSLLRLNGAPETLLTQALTTAELLDHQRGAVSRGAGRS